MERMAVAQAVSEEAARARSRGIPTMPPMSERLVHRLTHVPYRAWCQDCVAGRGREAARRKKTSKSNLALNPHLSDSDRCGFLLKV